MMQYLLVVETGVSHRVTNLVPVFLSPQIIPKKFIKGIHPLPQVPLVTHPLAPGSTPFVHLNGPVSAEAVVSRPPSDLGSHILLHQKSLRASNRSSNNLHCPLETAVRIKLRTRHLRPSMSQMVISLRASRRHFRRALATKFLQASPDNSFPIVPS